ARSALGRRRCHAPTHCGDRRWGAARLAVPPSAVGRTAVGRTAVGRTAVRPTAVRPTAGRRGATRRVAGFRQREGRAVQGPTGRPPARPYGRTRFAGRAPVERPGVRGRSRRRCVLQPRAKRKRAGTQAPVSLVWHVAHPAAFGHRSGPSSALGAGHRSGPSSALGAGHRSTLALGKARLSAPGPDSRVRRAWLAPHWGLTREYARAWLTPHWGLTREYARPGWLRTGAQLAGYARPWLAPVGFGRARAFVAATRPRPDSRCVRAERDAGAAAVPDRED